MSAEQKRFGRQDIERENELFVDRIAGLNGLKQRKVKVREVKKLYSVLMSNDPIQLLFARKLVGKYIGGPDTSPRRLLESAQQLRHSAEAWLDLMPQSLSYGLFSPSYIGGLAYHRRYTQPHESHTALLTGAFTPETINEYTTSVKVVYPEAQCAVVDIEGEKTKKEADTRFVFGDALSLPFADSSFDTVHTNILFNRFNEDGETKQPSFETISDVLSEGHRVLKDDGFLLLVEGKGAVRDGDLQKAGFTFIHRTSGLSFCSRRDMERSLTYGYDSIYNMYQVPIIDFVIAAKKRPSLLP